MTKRNTLSAEIKELKRTIELLEIRIRELEAKNIGAPNPFKDIDWPQPGPAKPWDPFRPKPYIPNDPWNTIPNPFRDIIVRD